MQENAQASIRTSSAIIFTEQIPCSDQFHEQEIPDDGSWIRVCLTDLQAPDQSVVTNVHVKYLLDHPDPTQLEIQLTRPGLSPTQLLWEGSKQIKETKFGEAPDLEAFNGMPAQGDWYLLVRDVVSGQSGWLRGVTVHAIYAPSEAVPALLAKAEGHLSFLSIPSKSEESVMPDNDEKKSKTENQSYTLLQTGGWQEIKHETFEGIFPNTSWMLVDANPIDGKEYLWDDDDFRHYNGNWAAWPANGGANGIDPAANSYPSNLNSRMIYGPFDLSDAGTAQTVFRLWREIEVYYDYVFFGISHDGNAFNGWYWDGMANWEEKSFNLDSYLGDDSVWVGWVFVSDGTVQYEGLGLMTY